MLRIVKFSVSLVLLAGLPTRDDTLWAQEATAQDGGGLPSTRTTAHPTRHAAAVPQGAASLNLTTIADHAALVIEGRVKSTQSTWSEDHKTINTTVELEEVAAYKGQLPESSATVTLEFPGGKIGDELLFLAGSPEYEVGQKWILFLLPEYRVYPVYGINQGAFKIVQDADGVERVYSYKDVPVKTITSEGKVEFENRVSLSNRSQERKAPSAPNEEPLSQGTITLEAFKNQIAPVLASSRAYPGTALPRKIITAVVESRPQQKSSETQPTPEGGP